MCTVFQNYSVFSQIVSWKSQGDGKESKIVRYKLIFQMIIKRPLIDMHQQTMQQLWQIWYEISQKTETNKDKWYSMFPLESTNCTRFIAFLITGSWLHHIRQICRLSETTDCLSVSKMGVWHYTQNITRIANVVQGHNSLSGN